MKIKLNLEDSQSYNSNDKINSNNLPIIPKTYNINSNNIKHIPSNNITGLNKIKESQSNIHQPTSQVNIVFAIKCLLDELSTMDLEKARTAVEVRLLQLRSANYNNI